MTQPNILFLMSDEHRPDVTGYEGDPVASTPVMDELARTGVVFRNAYTPSPACVPGRQCMMAGQLPRTCGCEKFVDTDLPPGSMTFARRFSRHAYETTCFGKLHHRGPDQLQGWTARPAGDIGTQKAFMEDPDEEAFQRHVHPKRVVKWDQPREVRRAGVGRGPHAVKDDLALQAARDYVTHQYFANPFYDREQVGRPLMLKLSLTRPHYPYLCGQDRFTYYLNRVRPFLEERTFDHPILSNYPVMSGVDVREREIRRAVAAYYGMIEEADHAYGRLMDELRHVGEDLDDWLIVYTSDHGEMLGEHGVWEKKSFFEASARVPLIIRPPRRDRERWGCEGRTVTENVNLCDLFATLCEMADVPLPGPESTVHGRGLDSRSLVPLMRGQTADWHEQYHNETVSQWFGTDLMIKRDALKYCWYERDRAGDQPEVLFDLERDPRERRNLIDEPAYHEAVSAFRARRGELGFGPEADPAYRNAGYHTAQQRVKG